MSVFLFNVPEAIPGLGLCALEIQNMRLIMQPCPPATSDWYAFTQLESLVCFCLFLLICRSSGIISPIRGYFARIPQTRPVAWSSNRQALVAYTDQVVRQLLHCVRRRTRLTALRVMPYQDGLFCLDNGNALLALSVMRMTSQRSLRGKRSIGGSSETVPACRRDSGRRL